MTNKARWGATALVAALPTIGLAQVAGRETGFVPFGPAIDLNAYKAS